MSKCKNCEQELTSLYQKSENCNCLYLVLDSIYDMKTLPCDKRYKGMLVTVIGQDESYRQFMLKGDDICNNSSWEELNIDISKIAEKIGHVSLENIDNSVNITDEYLNNLFPSALEGFKITVISLNTTFIKISKGRWILTNSLLNNG